MTQRTILHTRPAPQRRPGVRDGSSWHVPVALVVLSLIPVVAGSLRLLSSGWVVNATVAEWVIRRPDARRTRRARTGTAVAGSR